MNFIFIVPGAPGCRKQAAGQLRAGAPRRRGGVKHRKAAIVRREGADAALFPRIKAALPQIPACFGAVRNRLRIISDRLGSSVRERPFFFFCCPGV